MRVTAGFETANRPNLLDILAPLPGGAPPPLPFASPATFMPQPLE